MNISIEKQIDILSKDYDSGSTDIAVKALNILSAAFLDENAERLAGVRDRIIRAKPAMAAVANLAKIAYETFSDCTTNDDIRQKTDEIRKKIKKASADAVDNAVNELPGHDLNVVTCSYSSAVIRFFRELNKAGRLNTVYAVSSIWQEKDYALSIKEECDNLNIKCEIIKKHDLESIAHNAHFALTGADMISPEYLINGAPSIWLAERAKTHFPYYVIAESYKFAECVPDIGHGFEVIPRSFVKNIFTDNFGLNTADNDFFN
ncbi:MAG: hypothetical protein ACOC2K_01495 [Bacteroidota bacterium]